MEKAEGKEAKADGEVPQPGGRVLSYFTFPTSSKLSDPYQTVKRNLLQCSLGVREVSRHLSIILAGNFQRSLPGLLTGTLRPVPRRKCNSPSAVLLITKKNDGLIVFQQERMIYFIWKFGN